MENTFKKLSLITLIFVMGTGLFAQSLGIKGGLNLANMLIKDNDDTYSDDFKMNPGFHLGLTVETPIDETFSFESGLILSTKGFKIDESEEDEFGTYEYNRKVNLFYLDIPLTAKASFELDCAKIYGTFGPYVGIGLSGKVKSEYTEDGETETDEKDISFGSDEENDDLKRLDYGLYFGAGIEFPSVIIGISYGLGLANIAIDQEDGFKTKNRVLGISIAYKIGK